MAFLKFLAMPSYPDSSKGYDICVSVCKSIHSGRYAHEYTAIATVPGIDSGAQRFAEHVVSLLNDHETVKHESSDMDIAKWLDSGDFT